MTPPADGVVFLHGILYTYRHMAKLAVFLGTNAYRVLNINYPATYKSI